MSRLLKIGDALSQLANVALLPRHGDTTANESISGRAYRQGWKKAERFIDWLFSPFEKDHCRLSHEAEVRRARKLLGIGDAGGVRCKS
jgi:hypothetical protein